MPFTVIVADNFHYMDESESYALGTFHSLGEAIHAAKEVVDEYLASALQPGMSASDLYESYVSFGEDPWIRSPDHAGKVLFSGWDYARERCEVLCSQRNT